VKLLLNPVVARMGLVLLVAFAGFVIGVFVIHRMRKDLAQEAESLSQSPLAAEGLPIHAYHAVIQQLKQQKHELTAKQLEERRKAKVSDTLSATVLANLSCGVLFFNTAGLVRQVNPAARQLLGFAAPVGMKVADLLRTASLRLEGDPSGTDALTVEAALAPALSGKAVVRELCLDYQAPDGQPRVLELTVSPVMTDDARMIGTAFVLTDKTEIARLRQEQEMREEVSAEMALGLRNSLTTIAGYGQQLARSLEPELARQLANDIANEAAQLDRTIGSFLTGPRAAAAAVFEK
jgi:PAS domain-containing protein